MTSFKACKFTYSDAWGLFCDETERWLYESQGFYRVTFQTKEETEYLVSLITRNDSLVNPVASRLVTDEILNKVLEFHRFTFEGATGLLARHLREDHGVPAAKVAPFDGGLTQGHWTALDDMHIEAHAQRDYREDEESARWK